MSIATLTPANEFDRLRRKRWIQAALLTLLAHLAWLALPWEKILRFDALPRKKEQIEVSTFSKDALDALKRRVQEPRSLLLDRNQPAVKEAPDDAHYFSDRNIRVQKEQRARETAVLPKPGRPQPQGRAQRRSSAPSATRPADSAELLKRLGVPLGFQNRPRPAALPSSDAATSDENPAQAGGESGGDQYIRDPSLPVGGENMLNAQESVFYSFYSRLYQAVGPVWQSLLTQIRRAVPPGQYTTQVEVLLDREGKIVQVKFAGRSGIPEFDHVVEQAWQRLPRFPNAPRGLVQGDGYIHTGWTFTVNVGQNFFQVAPPHRVY